MVDEPEFVLLLLLASMTGMVLSRIVEWLFASGETVNETPGTARKE